MVDFIYTGPSWAVQSFTTSDGKSDKETVNIGNMFADEFNLSLEWCPGSGVSNTWCIDKIHKCNLPNDIPIVWIYCDPLGQIYYDDDDKRIMTWPCYLDKWEPLVQSFLTGTDWRTPRQLLVDNELRAMNDLGNPIALLGSHSDITTEQVAQYENLTIIEPSWQRILAEHCNIKPLPDYIEVSFVHQTIKIFLKAKEVFEYMDKHNIGKWTSSVTAGITKALATLVYKVFETESYENKINADLVEIIHNTYAHWKQFEEAGIWCWVHPNIQGNKIFYEHIKHKLKKFL